MKHGIPEACAHELHIFGTQDHTVASAKLGMLILMLIVNVSQSTLAYFAPKRFILPINHHFWNNLSKYHAFSRNQESKFELQPRFS